ncbi:MAG: redoxin domain-containing protein [Planctomycetaceae bacterium]|nr:redoxin domain-containing protein [Planctomycetaceae bacterium]
MFSHGNVQAAPIENFVLKDQNGKTRSLVDVKAKGIVLVVLGTECPLAKLYAGRLQELADDPNFAELTFWGIMPNDQDSAEEIREFAKTHQIRFPLLVDSRQYAADLLGATRTPEAFLLTSNREICYQGRIDDQFGIGTILPAAKSNDLRNAIQDLLAGKEIRVPKTEPVGCLIGRSPRSKPERKVTYTEHVAAIFQQHCVDCHREGQAAPFSMTDFQEVLGWTAMIDEVIREDRMPPWHADSRYGHFENDVSLSKEEKQIVADWIANGAPYGDPSLLPKPKEYSTSWLLPREPDLVLNITKTPYQVPAHGEVKYQYFIVDPQLTEDKWIAGAEIRPGNFRVVHHILVFSREKGTKGRANAEEGGFLAAYVPGMIPQPYPKGMAKQLPANSELVFQMHYTPIGSPQEDTSQIALLFADPETITHRVMTTSATNRQFEIPPQADNHEVTARSPRAQADVQLLTMMPHMHLRGKSFKYQVELPGKEPETILSIPRYDFNWQTSYRLIEPMLLPAGARMYCTAHFDNSSGNAYNPDPSQSVKWGDQTWEEMMIGYFDIAIPIQSGSQSSKALGGRPEQILARLDADEDGQISKAETPPKYWPIFLLIDTDRNGMVTLEELKSANRKFNNQ